ncbi:MAG: ketoacyl-ACP synthase III [Syntrophomonadaceae bacterium]|nr:ketoacyl-ACP synthase III [Syntrophomonadaceae bacterium]MDD3889612.1 ketoacyl-ACP synthase III [Syntrophomonadaceae bacterium]MDD4548372.1 ketoacyl-ACP synthase III [Syntrophomonadaceae bacterium]
MAVQVRGMGHALPDKVLNNFDLEQMVETNDEWIVERTGIKERRIADSNTATSDLCFEAARMALERAGVEAEELDLIIVATVTPDMMFPSTACIIQQRLGASKAAAFDLSAGCTGFIYGVTVAERFLSAPDCRYALIVGADVLSRITDFTDRNTCILFGDGAGAAVIGKGSTPGILSSYLGADGSGADLLYLPAGGSRIPVSHETIEKKLHFVRMHGNEIFRFASKIMVEICEKLLSRAELDYNDVDVFVPHQANLRIIKTAMKRMNIPPEKTLINIDQFGNMSAASIPVALSMAYEEGLLKDGQLILAAAFGAGLTYGGILFRWGRN